MISQEIFINMSHWSEIYQARTINGILVGENIFCSVKFTSTFYSFKKGGNSVHKNSISCAFPLIIRSLISRAILLWGSSNLFLLSAVLTFMAASLYTLNGICTFPPNPGSMLWESDSSTSSLSLNSFYSLDPEKPQSEIRTNRVMGFARCPEGVLIRGLYRGEAGGRGMKLGGLFWCADPCVVLCG